MTIFDLARIFCVIFGAAECFGLAAPLGLLAAILAAIVGAVAGFFIAPIVAFLCLMTVYGVAKGVAMLLRLLTTGHLTEPRQPVESKRTASDGGGTTDGH